MKKIRMDQEAYEEGSAFSVTIAAAERRPLFRDSVLVETCLAGLRSATFKYDASVYAYCFMPDHLHLLVSVPGGISLVNFIRHFKQLTAFDIRRLPRWEGGSLWQRRFYDHALRHDEQLDRVADYIWSNPVRAGLVSDASQYPHSGSFAWDVEFVSGSKDPDLRRSPPVQRPVGEGLQTRAPPAALASRAVAARGRGSSDPRTAVDQ